MNSRARLFLASLLGFCLAVLVGCGSGANAKLGTVEGKVTVNGVAANSGSVAFVGADGGTVGAPIQPDGKYSAVGVAVGNAKVVVVGPPPALRAAPGIAPMKDAPAAPGMNTVSNPVPIPAKYGNAETSGLSFPVKSGANTFPIELK